jgi:hypothetical protein
MLGNGECCGIVERTQVDGHAQVTLQHCLYADAIWHGGQEHLDERMLYHRSRIKKAFLRYLNIFSDATRAYLAGI